MVGFAHNNIYYGNSDLGTWKKQNHNHILNWLQSQTEMLVLQASCPQCWKSVIFSLELGIRGMGMRDPDFKVSQLLSSGIVDSRERFTQKKVLRDGLKLHNTQRPGGTVPGNEWLQKRDRYHTRWTRKKILASFKR